MVSILALEAGIADITVSYTEEGITETDIVEVTVSAVEPVVPVAVTGVTLVPETLALVAEGATGTLVETVAPPDASDPSVTWSSSDKTVAIVAAGVVTPLTAGQTTITVTTDDGDFEAICVVTVTAAEEPPVEKSTPPVITGVFDDSDIFVEDGSYVDAVIESGTVTGYCMDGSIVKLYLDDEDEPIATIDTIKAKGYATFEFTNIDLDLSEEEPRTLKATAQEPGLAVSEFSDPYTVTLDTTAPKILNVAIKAEGLEDGDKVTLTVTCSEEIDEDSLSVPDSGYIWGIGAGPSFESGYPEVDPDSIQYDRVAPKVFELSGKFEGDPTAGKLDGDNLVPDEENPVTEGTEFQVTYQALQPGAPIEVPITDLAGNELVDSTHTCYLVVE
ncbi:hypothetical protein ES708_29275 [subsurface metagenome]